MRVCACVKSQYILYVFTYILRPNVGCLTLSLPTWFIYSPVFRTGSLTEPGAHSFQSISFASPRDPSLSTSPALELYVQAAVLSFMWVPGIQIPVLKLTWQAPHRLRHLSSAVLYITFTWRRSRSRAETWAWFWLKPGNGRWRSAGALLKTESARNSDARWWDPSAHSLTWMRWPQLKKQSTDWMTLKQSRTWQIFSTMQRAWSFTLCRRASPDGLGLTWVTG